MSRGYNDSRVTLKLWCTNPKSLQWPIYRASPTKLLIAVLKHCPLLQKMHGKRH